MKKAGYKSMPISEKIQEKIRNLSDDEKLKELMLSILAEEDKGNYRFKDTYEKLVNAYLADKDGDEQ